MGRRKTAEEANWLAERYPTTPNVELLDAFERRFGWRMTNSSLASWACDAGLRKSSRGVAWREHPEYDQFLRETVPGRSESEIADAFEREFGIRLTASQVGNAKARLGVRSGTVGGRFEPGNVPANKGRTWDEMGIPEDKRERMRSGQFKPGNLPWTTRAVGEERVTKDGYVEVHVAQHRRERPNDQWVMKHRLVWEESNGRRLRPDEIVVFADGDRRNFDPDNLVVMTMAEHAVIIRSGITYADRETCETAIGIARLKMAASRASMRPRRCRRCGREFALRYERQRTCDACLGREAR